MWGSCCLVCQTGICPQNTHCYSKFNKCPLGIGPHPRHTDGPCPHTCVCQSQLAIGTMICFSDHCGWHSSETKSVNSNSAVDFFQESCKRDWMHFVCLALDYERTHNNDLTVHAKTLQLPRTFTLSLVSWLLPFFLKYSWQMLLSSQGSGSPRGSGTRPRRIRQQTAEPGPKPTQLLWLWSQ